MEKITYQVGLGGTNPEGTISCVLITKQKRDEYPELIWERLKLGFFREIIVVWECESIYQRYLAAAGAACDIIYVQDDDCMVNYQNLFKSYNGQITNAMPQNRIADHEALKCTLVGWGCYFPKQMLRVFDKYIAKYGVDKHLLREADRIFTYLNRPFNTVIMPHEDLPQTPDRMSFDTIHYTSRNEALQKCKVLV